MIVPFVSNLGLSATSGGQLFDLNMPSLRLFRYSGTGHMNINRLSQTSAGQRGSSARGLSQPQRPIELTWQIVEHALQGYYVDGRGVVLNCFYPREDDPIMIVFDVPGQGLRAAVGDMQGSVDFLPEGRTHTLQNVSVTLLASDPRMFDPTQREVNITAVTGALGWLMPWPFPWQFSNDVVNAVTTITYAGADPLAAPEFPLLRIHGPVSNPVILQETIEERIDLTGLSFGTGRFAEVDLTSGPYHDSSPTIRMDTGESVEQFLSDDSSLNDFHLAPKNELLPDGTRCTGDNDIRFQGNGASSTTRLQLLYFDRFTGF